ncbi:hypothetical protein FGO68_gene634 [Halteria grandinella]|uniref:Uncharacterized protein n=1 Tax=Halteria grandinella TaxID=5974 RepID=A0A8J8NM76_HALGN|nr:hypothetical protein FGO68_gene634 [Halteria grandinella]
MTINQQRESSPCQSFLYRLTQMRCSYIETKQVSLNKAQFSCQDGPLMQNMCSPSLWYQTWECFRKLSPPRVQYHLCHL